MLIARHNDVAALLFFSGLTNFKHSSTPYHRTHFLTVRKKNSTEKLSGVTVLRLGIAFFDIFQKMQSLQLNTCYVRCFVCIVFLCISSQYCFVQNLLEIHRILCTLSENTAAKQKLMTWHELPTAVLKSSELTSSSELDCRVCWYKSVS